MSATVCIHGIPVDPFHIHCPKCEAMPPVDAVTAEEDDDFCIECGHNHIGPCADEGQPDPDYGGAFDGFTVSSDADPGL